MKKIKILAIIATLITLFALTACSSNSGSISESDIAPEQHSKKEYGIDSKISYSTTYQSSADTAEYEQKIIYETDISAETTEYAEAVETVKKLCKDAGGYIESSNTYGTSYSKSSRSAYFVLRIPSSALNSFTEQIGSTVTVTRISSNSKEVTQTYYDIQARLNVLQLQKASLEEMYKNYTDYSSIDQLLALQDSIFNVITEIEQLQTQLNLYDNLVEYSTVNISINEVIIYSDSQDYGERISTAITESWDDFAEGFKDFTVDFVYAIPGLLVFLIIPLAIFLAIFLPIRAKHKKKNNNNNN